MPYLQEIGLQPVAPNGVLGDPRLAQAERGDRYLAAQVRSCERQIAGTVQKRNFTSPPMSTSIMDNVAAQVALADRNR
ncbi:MAG: hypothetical protein R3F37_10425 [Candidatus Competibacteraceae bacterium]